ncbi:MAG: glycosyltransferase, partial [Desulfobacterales bacterium]|nr:glycosyltransferase [Desulfobacterales bacterium]
LNERDYPALAVHRPGSPVGGALSGETRRKRVPMRNGWDVFSAFSIRRLVREERPAIVQTYMGRATRLTRLPRKSRAVHVARLGGYYKIKGYYEHAHAWVANTRGLRDYMVREGLPADRIYHIGNFVDAPASAEKETLDALRASLEIPPDAIILFSLGRLIDIKGFDDLLDAFARLPRDVGGRPVFLVIAGDGPLAEPLHRQADGLNISQRLRWAGWRDDATPFYHLADIFLCPSRRETLGNVILEAWAHQLPVISTMTPGGLELIVEGENGLLSPLDDPGALSARIHELLKAGPASWMRMAQKGGETLAENHAREAVIRAYLDMYEELRNI